MGTTTSPSFNKIGLNKKKNAFLSEKTYYVSVRKYSDVYCSVFFANTYYGRIHLVLNKTLTDDTSVKWAQIKTFLCFIQFC